MLPVEAAGTATAKTLGWVPQLARPCLPAATRIPSHLTDTEMSNAEPCAAVLNITILGALKMQRQIMKQKKLKKGPGNLAASEILLSPKCELASVGPCHMPAPPRSWAKRSILETCKCRELVHHLVNTEECRGWTFIGSLKDQISSGTGGQDLCLSRLLLAARFLSSLPGIGKPNISDGKANGEGGNLQNLFHLLSLNHVTTKPPNVLHSGLCPTQCAS